jgi:hypothetical protein
MILLIANRVQVAREIQLSQPSLRRLSEEDTLFLCFANISPSSIAPIPLCRENFFVVANEN